MSPPCVFLQYTNFNLISEYVIHMFIKQFLSSGWKFTYCCMNANNDVCHDMPGILMYVWKSYITYHTSRILKDMIRHKVILQLNNYVSFSYHSFHYHHHQLFHHWGQFPWLGTVSPFFGSAFFGWLGWVCLDISTSSSYQFISLNHNCHNIIVYKYSKGATISAPGPLTQMPHVHHGSFVCAKTTNYHRL